MVDEERLELGDIQGAIVPGFKNDHLAILLLKIVDAAGCKRWLRARAAEVATAQEVLSHNRLFKAMRARRGHEAHAPRATWISISLSHHGMALLLEEKELDKAFRGADAFSDGMYQSALADPSPAEWVLGGTTEEVPHLLVTVAGDHLTDVEQEVDRLDATMTDAGDNGGPILRRVHDPVMGSVLPGNMAGHEHFGFRDGISQPAIRGIASDRKDDFVEDRRLAKADPLYDRFASPGRPLIWPGQIIVGYKRQNRLDPITPAPAFVPRAPWVRNGSYLVFRRLRQQVDAFWTFCADGASRLGQELDRQVDALEFASMLVGRWPSGAPLVRAPGGDNPALGGDDDVNNDFLFTEETPTITLQDGGSPGGTFPAAHPDPDGLTCPFVAHIRKVNPRDDSTDTSGPRQTLARLMVRRGIPYGEAADRDQLTTDDGRDRGLLFLSYQSSIEEQFEFVTKTWVNRVNSPHDSVPPAGQDPLIGPSGESRFIRIPHPPDSKAVTFGLPSAEWVVMTGGGYFFTPSVSALHGALGT